MADERGLLGKTIVAIERDYFNCRDWWVVTFEDGSEIVLHSDTDYSDINCDIQVVSVDEYREVKAEEFED